MKTIRAAKGLAISGFFVVVIAIRQINAYQDNQSDQRLQAIGSGAASNRSLRTGKRKQL